MILQFLAEVCSETIGWPLLPGYCKLSGKKWRGSFAQSQYQFILVLLVRVAGVRVAGVRVAGVRVAGVRVRSLFVIVITFSVWQPVSVDLCLLSADIINLIFNKVFRYCVDLLAFILFYVACATIAIVASSTLFLNIFSSN